MQYSYESDPSHSGPVEYQQVIFQLEYHPLVGPCTFSLENSILHLHYGLIAGISVQTVASQTRRCRRKAKRASWAPFRTFPLVQSSVGSAVSL